MEDTHSTEDATNSVINDTATKSLLGGECGKRLVAHIIDETARVTPHAECMAVPRSSDLREGWKPVSWAQFANAVDHAAHMLIEHAGPPAPGMFPTVAYIGVDDPRYVAFMIGAIKAGFQALFVSPRNSLEAQLNLFDKTGCDLLFHEQQYGPMVQPWVDGRPGMRGVAVAPFDEWMADGVAPFPYTKTFAEAEHDPLVALHTSGTTGLPKPVVLRQGMIASNDLHRLVPARNGNRLWLPTWTGYPNPKSLLVMPMFHAAGLMMATLCCFYYNAPISFREPSRPITADNMVQWLKSSNSGWTVLPPAILDQMSRMQEGIDILKKLHGVIFGGGAVSPDSPNLLAKNGINTVQCVAATEFVFFPYYSQPDPTMWSWFIIPKDIMGIEWRPFGENVYEQVIVRKDKRPGLQGCFYTFPELDEYSTKDLYRPHPTLPDHWQYVARADDIIVFSTGEKLNPVTIESAVQNHPSVTGAQVVGSRYFHAALLIEPAQHPSNDQEKKAFLDEIWPIIEKVNAETVAHGRISRDFVFLSDPERPFPRAGKGTIQRAMAVKVYKDDIDRIFQNSKSVPATATDLDVTSEEAFADSMRSLFQNTTKFSDLDEDADFFGAGVDSLQVIQLSRVLRASLEKAGTLATDEAVTPRAVYAHPTIAQLTAYAYSLVRASSDGGQQKQPNGHANGSAAPAAVSGNSDDEAAFCDALVERYTHDLPAPVAGRPPAADDGQVVVITGTTGALGSYLLAAALASPRVRRVVCLNRSADGRAAQAAASAARGLPGPDDRVEFLRADLALPDLGLGAAAYARLAADADRVVHCAWPVHFHLSVASFEPHVRGVRHLVDLCARAARKAVPITFVSSIGTVEGWAGPGPVPEAPVPDWSAAGLGYGKSKLAGSMILDRAAEVSGQPRAVVRVGQIAGPRGEKGRWNPQEWLPSLIRSSLYLGMLPSTLGTFGDMGWAPSEDVANVVLEVSGVTAHVPVEEINGYFHALNPKPVDWAGLVPSLREFYGDRIRVVVSLEEWVDALDKSQARMEDVDQNPGVKLLDTYRNAMMEAKRGVRAVQLATERTESYSPTMRRMEATSPGLMRHWCEQWQF